jgi:hypothetical protein
MIKKLNFKQMKYLYFKGIMKNNHFKNKMKILTLLFVFFIPQLFYGQITFNCFSLAETTYQESEEDGIYFPVENAKSINIKALLSDLDEKGNGSLVLEDRTINKKLEFTCHNLSPGIFIVSDGKEEFVYMFSKEEKLAHIFVYLYATREGKEGSKVFNYSCFESKLKPIK